MEKKNTRNLEQAEYLELPTYGDEVYTLPLIGHYLVFTLTSTTSTLLSQTQFDPKASIRIPGLHDPFHQQPTWQRHPSLLVSWDCHLNRELPKYTSHLVCRLTKPSEWSWAVAAHLPYFAQSANYKIAALQNNSVETAKKAIEVHKLRDDVHAHGDVQSIASNPNIGLVATAVKVPLHAVAIEAALNAKKSAFCE